MTLALAALELVVGLTGGALAPDGDLRDYRWDTTPRTTFGAQAAVVRGAFAAGAHVWMATTTQETGLEGEAAPDVRLSTAELTGSWRAFTVMSVSLHANASVGRVHLGYHPDVQTFDVEGIDVTVAFDPVDEWIYGVGLAIRRPIARTLGAGVRFDYHVFGLDTAHRNGDTIERERESFGNWSGRLELSYRFGLL